MEHPGKVAMQCPTYILCLNPEGEVNLGAGMDGEQGQQVQGRTGLCPRGREPRSACQALVSLDTARGCRGSFRNAAHACLLRS